MADAGAQLVQSLGRILQSTLVSIEIVPGDPETWGASNTEGFLLSQSPEGQNLGVFQKHLYSIYPTAVSMLKTSAHNASAVILLANPAHQTAWNARKHLVLQSEPHFAESELLFSERLMPSSKPAAKESIAWAYRRWLLHYIYGATALPVKRVESEFLLVSKCCELYPRNYFAWSHHYFTVDCLVTALDADHNLDSPYIGVLLGRAHSLRRWIETHVSDFSAMDQYCKLLSRVNSLSYYRHAFSALLDPPTHLHHTIELIQTYPNESLWMFLRALLIVFPQLVESAVSLTSDFESVHRDRFARWVQRIIPGVVL
ncbi:hypothetical protein MIND_00027500 [Mycena indigotica]|uniref:Uncharacterized protein n=1 Tax=Mycena indigotica TaxID=2126181 RepID=A0A8H6TEC0_9AGAR|nr:uncharacterized protein MIND_00027500 [Mycena indigotica]KAF7315132.1 hypothetical protein MIND_00027500 [Mycena indigotica]